MAVTLEPGTLWPSTVRTTERALASGALEPIETQLEIVEDGGIRFAARAVSSLRRKRRAERAGNDEPADPFVSYDPELFVADVSDAHVCLLNKFNVMEHHLLLVTRRYVPQETLLDEADFEALWACLDEVDGLAFYNAGRTAGASQPHKHMQLVPAPLGEGPERTPVDGAVLAGSLPFAHAAAPFEADPHRARARYRELLARVEPEHPPAPYNFLATPQWMMVVPRRRERVGSISVNALGFAGSLLAKSRDELETIRRLGPLSILRSVAEPPR